MNYKRVCYYVGWILKIEALFMLFPFMVSMYYREETGFSFLSAIAVTAAIGTILTIKKPSKPYFYAKEGFITTALSWIMISIMGSIPFYVSGTFPNFVDALFETVSGFSTTGASVAADIESMPRGMLFWRCLSNWIGGMGVLVFMLAIIPMAKDGQNLHLMQAESTGPAVSKILPKIKTTAITLYLIYIFMTLAQIILMMLGGMSFYDSMCISFATAGTGGFGLLNDSIASYNGYIQIVITIFMLLFGINFIFYFMIINKRYKDAFKIEEVKWYFIIYAVVVILISVNQTYYSGQFMNNLYHSIIQSASMITTTAFSTTDYNLWTQFSKSLLLMLMFIGSCAGSTGGGIKVSRILIYAKTIKKELAFLLHHRRVNVIFMNGRKIENEVVRLANTFLMAYFMLLFVSTILLSLENLDFTTTFTASAASLNNIGLGFDLIGPTGNYAGFSDFSKVVLMFNMLAGRLEIFPMLLLFMPRFYKK